MNKGDICYLENGQKVEYAGNIGTDHFVHQIYITESREAGSEEWTSEKLTTVKKVFAEEPVAIWGAQIEKLEATTKTLLREKLALEADIKALSKGIAVMKDAAKTLPDIATALDFHEGRIKFIVVNNYGALRVEDFDKSLMDTSESYGNHHGMKLICLFGTDANRQTRWKINNYRDGSGSWAEIFPFHNREDAEAFVRERFMSEILKWRAGNQNDVSKFEKCGVQLDWPTDWLVSRIALKESAKSAEVAKLKARLAELEGTK